MPGGLMALVAYGSQNVILNGNPEFTFFYKVFKRHSHFSKENITIPVDGPNELLWDQPIKIRAKIPRNADLLTDLMFVFDLPDIYSKFSLNTRTYNTQYEFAWSRWLGANILQNVAFYVGGTKIQEFDGDYCIAKALLDYPTDKYKKWQKLVGDIPELINPGIGINSGSLQSGIESYQYPTVLAFPTPSNLNPALLNPNPLYNIPPTNIVYRPSIYSQKVYVPLPFWFSESPANALPLVALQYHECEVQITLKSIQELYTIRDISGYGNVNPLYRTLLPTLNPIIDTGGEFDSIIFGNNPEFLLTNDKLTMFNSFLTDPTTAPPPLNTFYYNGRFEATYIYLTDEERKVFASSPLQYCIQQQTIFMYDSVYNRTTFDLQITNPVTRLIVVPRRSDQLQYRNTVDNFTNWAFYPNQPNSINGLEYLMSIQNRATVLNPAPESIKRYFSQLTQSQLAGLVVPNAQINIIQSMRVLLDGNEIQEEKPIEYFVHVTPYIGLNGGGQVEAQYIPTVEFSLNGPDFQPSGSVNASRIRNFQLEINPYPLPANTNYMYTIKVIAETYNFFVVEGGMGGLKYAL
jgi:hypothetical protein